MSAHLRSLRLVLFTDAAVEVAIGAALLAWRGQIAGWLATPDRALVALGVVFLAAGPLVAAIALPRFVASARPLAWANIAGGTLGWLTLLTVWQPLAPEGRWLLAAASDAFIAVGVLELVALRRMPGPQPAAPA
jgi:hypothetical protein